jgi:hypothetical protein
VDNKTNDEMTGKIEWDKHHHTQAPWLLPKLKSLHDLSVTIEAKVAEEAINYVVTWVDGGAQLHVLLHRVLDPSNSLQKFHHKTITLDPVTSGLCRIATRLCGPCSNGMKDEDCDKSSDTFQECDEVSRLDEVDERTCLTFLKCLLHPTTILTKMMHRKGPSTLGVSIKH